MGKHVRIENISSDGLSAVALGGTISTQSGTAFDLFDKKVDDDVENKENLIRKVVKSGHTSILEHMSFSILLTNVSVCIEEFFIEHRLASFTVKSRRYVDFKDAGFYVPEECKENPTANEIYCNDMTNLFESYDKLVELGIPKEDARFLLPYSFHDNFICSLNAREAIHIITDLYKMGCEQANIAGYEIEECDNEYLDLYIELMVELKLKLPVIHDIVVENISKMKSIQYKNNTITNEFDYGTLNGKYTFILYTNYGEDESCIHDSLAGKIDNYFIRHRCYSVVYPCGNDGRFRRSLRRGLQVSDNSRVLEFFNWDIEIEDISLSSLTHLVRHRMQSIITPRLDQINPTSFIIPNSIAANEDACNVYIDAISKHIESIKKLEKDLVNLPWVRQYLLLSGNTVDNIITQMNARELLLFMKLRTCNRAQWEIRFIANDLLKQLREYDDIFYDYGPSCYVDGSCPEGRLSCGQIQTVKEKYKCLHM